MCLFKQSPQNVALLNVVIISWKLTNYYHLQPKTKFKAFLFIEETERLFMHSFSVDLISVMGSLQGSQQKTAGTYPGCCCQETGPHYIGPQITALACWESKDIFQNINPGLQSTECTKIHPGFLTSRLVRWLGTCRTGLRIGVFLGKAPVRTKLGRWFGCRGRCHDTFTALTRYFEQGTKP